NEPPIHGADPRQRCISCGEFGHIHQFCPTRTKIHPPDPGIVRQPTSNTNPWKHSYGAFSAQAADAVVETSAVQQQTPGGHQQQQQQEYAAKLQQSQ
ncbi:unnamed protein product, partial [Pylaiella littoralis]